MRLWSIVALLAICTTAAAASMEDLAKALPPCALECFINAIPASPCAATNQTCLCTDPGFTANVETCVMGACTIRQALTTKNVTYTMCDMPVRDRTILVSGIGLAGVGIAFVVFCLRLIARLPCCGGQFGWDDWTMVLTMVCVIPLSALSWVLADDGLGLDMWTVPFDNITHILYVYFWDELLYLSAVGLTKISILCFYLRVFPRREVRRLIYVAIGLNVSYVLVFNIITIFQCNPVQGAWLRWDEEHEFKCNNVNGQVWCSAIFNIILDAMVMALPMRELYMLNLSWRKKAFVMCMFCLGIFVTLVSVIRLDALIVFANTTNVTWDYVKVGYWSTIEVHVGVICACLPALRSLFRRIWPCVFGDTQVGTSQWRRTKSTGTGSRSALKHGDDHFVPLVDMGNGSAGPYKNDPEHNARF